jgi:hypothetical protein
MPIVGVLDPMVAHTGDGTGEIMSYILGTVQWKAGEMLGTWPFFLAGAALPQLRSITESHLAESLAIIGICGSLGFLALAVEFITGCWGEGISATAGGHEGTAIGRYWRKFITVSEDQRGYLMVLSFLTIPILFIYGGFIQTTFFALILFPWSVFFAVRLAAGLGKPQRLSWYFTEPFIATLVALLGYLCHSVAIVVLAGVFGVLLVAGVDRLSMFKLRGRSDFASLLSSLPSKQAGLGLCGMVAAITVYHFLFSFISNNYHLVYRDSWTMVGSVEKLYEKINAFRTILHAVPPWVPYFGQDVPTCGQQTWFFSVDWVAFTFGSLIHTSGVLFIIPFAAVLYLAPTKISFPKSPASRYYTVFFGIAAFLSLGFISVFSPHYSEPKDMDIILLPAAAISLFVIYLIGRGVFATSAGQAGHRYWGPYKYLLFALVIYQLLMLCGAFSAQSGWGNSLFIRGVSTPYC